MNVRVLESARRHPFEGYQFYEEQASGLGRYFLRSLFAEIESLETHVECMQNFTAFIAGYRGDFRLPSIFWLNAMT